jgi:hypothetical protein
MLILFEKEKSFWKDQRHDPLHPWAAPASGAPFINLTSKKRGWPAAHCKS